MYIWQQNFWWIFDERWRPKGHKGQTRARAKFPFDYWTVVVWYITYSSTYLHMKRTCVPETRHVRIARGYGKDGGSLPIAVREYYYGSSRWEEDDDGQTWDISTGLAFMWRPTVELIFTRFGAASPLPPLFLFSNLASRARVAKFSIPTPDLSFRLPLAILSR